MRDYGNRMGIPTVNGALAFDERYLANPLVYCGCVGMIPRDRIDKCARPGRSHRAHRRPHRARRHSRRDVLLRPQLTDTHADEFSHAVQIGNAIDREEGHGRVAAGP